jgi:single-stranded DNA-binding protein
MNSCILMAQVSREPQLRATQDGLTVADMLVEFEDLGHEATTTTLKVVGWGKLAEEIKNKYNPGDRVIIEGRLSMNTIETQEGYKEKRAELVASKIYPLDGYTDANTSTKNYSSSSLGLDSYDREPPSASATPIPREVPATTYASNAPAKSSQAPITDTENSEDWDEIPF